MMTVYFKNISTQVGMLKIVCDDEALVAILWEFEKPNRVKLGPMHVDEDHPILKAAEKELKQYFKGKRKSFDIPTKLRGSQFQQAVWNALHDIPYGTMVTYSDIAKAIANPRALRAVGAAIGQNPLSIILPCHRVIGKNGSLTGFAGTLPVKKALLELEGEVLKNDANF